ncbi:MAG: S-layer homology domain-containing protein [Clostridia bacterium]|nr:S-layer homology domain-containing protein [Clostridia bacterium]
MKRLIKGIIIVSLTFAFMLSFKQDANATNRIIYKIKQTSMDKCQITLKWSEKEAGNIQITSIVKQDNDTVNVFYKANGDKNVRTASFNVKELGLTLERNKPNVILKNPNGAYNKLSDLPKQDGELKDAIQNLYGQGVINGYTDGTFKAGSSITKEEFSSMFFNLMDYTLVTSEQSKFKDVANNRWSKNIIMTLNKLGIITGQTDGNFGALKNVSLGEACTIFTRSKNIQAVSGANLKHVSKNH